MPASTPRTAPPFRADHVGSLLRPARLLAAREQFLGPQTPQSHLGPHDNADLRAVEDGAIRECIGMQERVGLRAATDGEFRRRSWWLELILGWEGFEADRTGSTRIGWRNETGVVQAFSALNVTGRIRWRPSSTVRAFEFLKANTRLVPKVTLPAPNTVQYFVGDGKNINRSAYPDMESFWADLVAAYQQELLALVAAGARYIQYDDTTFAFLCDPMHRDHVRSWGEDPDRLMRTYATRINETLSVLPPEVTVTFHQCRGNREGLWAAQGGYDPVAEILFNAVNVHGYFLEYDSARAGGFEPLRFLPKGKSLVLGVMSSKTGELESADTLERRIDAAGKFAPLDQLAISPQCGFASSIKGNPLTPVEQEAKLARLVEVATKVWGGV
ncbi:MAG: 5-methyltetrahydropteroyltriglutamate--homocysteine S-methyltransferase [Burkholderiales bacterium]